MSGIRRRLLIIGSAGVLAAALAGAGAGNAAAYGTVHVFQITLSENCQDPVLCVASSSNPFGIGGIWGWVEPDSNGSAEASIEFQGHQNALAFLNGSGHVTGQGSAWFQFSSATPPPFTPTDPNGNYLGVSLQFPFGPATLAFPATPGQYTASFGPGINSEITVTQMR